MERIEDSGPSEFAKFFGKIDFGRENFAKTCGSFASGSDEIKIFLLFFDLKTDENLPEFFQF